MKKVVHDLVEKLTKAIVPITYEHKDYNNIIDAMCVIMAKTIQSTPNKGTEINLLKASNEVIAEYLKGMMKLDLEEKESKESSILEFSKFAKPADDK